VAAAQFEALRAEEAPSAHHEERTKGDEETPCDRLPPQLQRIAPGKMNDRGQHAGRRRNRHSDKILLARASWIGRLRINLDIETSQAAGTGHEKDKTSDDPDLP